MDTDNVERLLERYAAGLADEEAWDQLRPEVREKLEAYARRRSRPPSRVAPLLGIGGSVLALAACLVLLLMPRKAAIGLTVTVAGSEDSLFTRDAMPAPFTDELWIGIEVDRPCWIYLVERTESGQLFIMRTSSQPDGYGLEVLAQQPIGDFKLFEPRAEGGPSRVSHVLAIASEDRIIDAAALEEGIPDWLAPGEDETAVVRAFDNLAQSLRRSYGWTVRFQRIPPPDEPT